MAQTSSTRPIAKTMGSRSIHQQQAQSEHLYRPSYAPTHKVTGQAKIRKSIPRGIARIISATMPSTFFVQPQHSFPGFVSISRPPHFVNGFSKCAYVASYLQIQQNLKPQKRHVIILQPAVFSILVLHRGQKPILDLFPAHPSYFFSIACSHVISPCHSSLHLKHMLNSHSRHLSSVAPS